MYDTTLPCLSKVEGFTEAELDKVIFKEPLKVNEVCAQLIDQLIDQLIESNYCELSIVIQLWTINWRKPLMTFSHESIQLQLWSVKI